MTFTTHWRGPVLFNFWSVQTLPQLLASCAAVLALALAYEALGEWRARFTRRHRGALRQRADAHTLHQPLLSNGDAVPTPVVAPRSAASVRVLQTAAHMAQLALAYLVRCACAWPCAPCVVCPLAHSLTTDYADCNDLQVCWAAAVGRPHKTVRLRFTRRTLTRARAACTTFLALSSALVWATIFLHTSASLTPSRRATDCLARAPAAASTKK